MYGGAEDWYSQNNQSIQDAAGTAGMYSNAALGAVAQPWMQNLQGGNLAGYDIAGGLSNMIGQDMNITPSSATGTLSKAQQFGAGPGVQSQQFGAGPGVQSQQFSAGPGVQSIGMGAGSDINSNAIGQLSRPTYESNVYQNRIGPGGSLNNMKGMYRNDARVAGQDMLGAMDSRAAASGMSGGSAHGNAVGRGFEGINRNLQDNLARTGYDAYNRDIDRSLNIAGKADQFNEQRAGLDQQNFFNTQATNQANQFRYGQQNQANNMQAQLANQQNQFNTNQANQGANLSAQSTNQANQFNTNQTNQASNLAAQQGNQQNQFNTNTANQGADLAAQQGNQQAATQAGIANMQNATQVGMANQNYASGQQQLMGNMIGQQQGTSESAINQQQEIQNFINGPLQSIMQSAGGLQMLQGLLGNPATLTDSQGTKNGGAPGGGGNYSLGTSGANVSF